MNEGRPSRLCTISGFAAKTFLCLSQDKVTKEVNYILANQETIKSQLTHLDDAIKQMEVNFFYSVLTTDPLGPSRGLLL